jgi:hypothetical protein
LPGKLSQLPMRGFIAKGGAQRHFDRATGRALLPDGTAFGIDIGPQLDP